MKEGELGLTVIYIYIYQYVWWGEVMAEWCGDCSLYQHNGVWLYLIPAWVMVEWCVTSLIKVVNWLLDWLFWLTKWMEHISQPTHCQFELSLLPTLVMKLHNTQAGTIMSWGLDKNRTRQPMAGFNESLCAYEYISALNLVFKLFKYCLFIKCLIPVNWQLMVSYWIRPFHIPMCVLCIKMVNMGLSLVQ